MGKLYGYTLELPFKPNFDEIIEGIDYIRKMINEINVSDGLDMSTLRTGIKGNEWGVYKLYWKAKGKGDDEDVPVVHARWEKSEYAEEKYRCSACGGACWYYDYQGEVARSRYCPNCGARMDAEEVET